MGDEKEEGGYTLNNLITSLLLFINNPEVRDTDYQIASCLLEHCYEIKNMTIQELAEKSYVSVSTINRFLKMYGFGRYSIFKVAFYQHVQMRYRQMIERLHQRDPEQIDTLLHAILSEQQYQEVTDQTKIERFCQAIDRAERLVLIGSDEMIATALRFQGDFVVMGKTVLKDSMYKGNRLALQASDLVFIFSMTGRIFDLSNHLLQDLQINQPEIWMCGHYNFLAEENSFFGIPEAIDEIAENLIFDYYLSTITYHYAQGNLYDR